MKTLRKWINKVVVAFSVVLLVIMLAMGVSISVSVGLSSAVAMLCMLPADVSSPPAPSGSLPGSTPSR